MRQENSFVRPTMAAPAPGFTARVMARIEERECARARRRALLGAVVLLAASSSLLALLGYVLLTVFSALLDAPALVVSGLGVLAPVIEIVASFLEALAVSAETVVRVGSVQMFVYALAVCALTLVWAYVVHSSPQWFPRTLSVGGRQ